jgi:hypothetical protein
VTAPYPVLHVADVPIPLGDTGAEVPDRVSVEAASVTWGRAGILEHAEPSTAEVAIFDRTGGWAVTQDVIGAALRLGWTTTGVDGADYFRGRVTNASLQPITLGGVDGTLVRLSGISTQVDLGNITPTGAWPAETINTRVGRIVAASGGVLTGVDLPGATGADLITPVAADQQTTLAAHLQAVFDSIGANRMAWTPAGRASFVPRYSGWSSRTLGELHKVAAGSTTQGRGGAGVFARSAARTDTVYGGTHTGGLYLDAAHLDRDPGVMFRDLASRISVLNFGYYQLVAGAYVEQTDTTGIGGVDPAVTGHREARVDSALAGGSGVFDAFQSWALTLRDEAQSWRPEPVGYSPGRFGGFEDPAVRDVLLCGYEQPRPIFVQRSMVSRRVGLRPVYGLHGGVITYAGGDWTLELNLSPLFTPERQHALTWAEIDDGTSGNTVRWYLDDGEHADGLHPSVTFEDLAYVGTGLGASGPGPDTGWDTDQQ